jgi:creatinine amidohydrolase
MHVVTETCVSTAKHGAKYLLILNWHEGNIPALAIAAESLHREHKMTVLTVQACYVAADLFGRECQGLTHGGEIETLAAMAYRSDLVHLECAGNSSNSQQGRKLDSLRRTPAYQPILTDIRAIAPTGWYGSPQSATTERGLHMVGAIADAIAKESIDIFHQLDSVNGGLAEVKELHRVQ